MTRMAARGRYDYTLLTVLGILVLSGLIILYSTSAYNGEVKFCDSSYYLKKQVFATCLGFLAMFFTSQIEEHSVALLSCGAASVDCCHICGPGV